MTRVQFLRKNFKKKRKATGNFQKTKMASGSHHLYLKQPWNFGTDSKLWDISRGFQAPLLTNFNIQYEKTRQDWRWVDLKSLALKSHKTNAQSESKNSLRQKMKLSRITCLYNKNLIWINCCRKLIWCVRINVFFLLISKHKRGT